MTRGIVKAEVPPASGRGIISGGLPMHSIIYLVGLIVIVLAVLSLVGLA